MAENSRVVRCRGLGVVSPSELLRNFFPEKTGNLGIFPEKTTNLGLNPSLERDCMFSH